MRAAGCRAGGEGVEGGRLPGRGEGVCVNVNRRTTHLDTWIRGYVDTWILDLPPRKAPFSNARQGPPRDHAGPGREE